MSDELDPKIVAELDAMRSRHFQQEAIQKQLNEMRERQISGNAPENETQGALGVWNDVKGAARELPFAAGRALLAAPHAMYQAGEQLAKLPYENLKFIGKTAMHGYRPENIPKASANMISGLIKAINIPSSAIDYAGEKGFIPQNLGQHIRAGMPDVGLKEEEENPILQSLPTLGYPGLKLAEEAALTKSLAARPLRQARKLSAERGLEALHMPEHIFEDARQFLPDTHANRNLINQARTGNYDKLFTLQSDLGKAGTKLTRSASGAERLHGAAAHELRQNLLNAIKQELKTQGHEDIAKLMEKGQKLYKRNKKYTKPLSIALGTALLGQSPIQHGFHKMTKILE